MIVPTCCSFTTLSTLPSAPTSSTSTDINYSTCVEMKSRHKGCARDGQTNIATMTPASHAGTALVCSPLLTTKAAGGRVGGWSLSNHHSAGPVGRDRELYCSLQLSSIDPLSAHIHPSSWPPTLSLTAMTGAQWTDLTVRSRLSPVSCQPAVYTPWAHSACSQLSPLVIQPGTTTSATDESQKFRQAHLTNVDFFLSETSSTE